MRDKFVEFGFQKEIEELESKGFAFENDSYTGFICMTNKEISIFFPKVNDEDYEQYEVYSANGDCHLYNTFEEVQRAYF